jgi:L-iditol 2-dehydrogenase
MRTVELVARRKMEVRERPDPPPPGPGEILVRLRAVGICGSDLHWYQDGGIGHTQATYPMILGHEPVGDIVEVGKGVTSHHPGEQVAIEPSIVCGECEYCRSGRPNICQKCVFLGSNGPGMFRDYAVIPARNAEHLPPSLGYLEACLIEPTSVIVHTFTRIVWSERPTVAILGAGPMGALCAVMALIRDAAAVWLVDRVAHRLDLARRLDPRIQTVDSACENIVRRLTEATSGRGFDIIIDAAGALETMNAGLRSVRPGGQFILLGLPTDYAPALDVHTAMNREIVIQTVRRSNLRGYEAIDLLKNGKIPVGLITHRMPLEKTPDAFALLDHYRDGVGKLIIELC